MLALFLQILTLYSQRFPHIPEHLAQVGSALFARGDHEKFGDFEIFWIGEEQDNHFLDKVCAQGHVVIRSYGLLYCFLLPPGEGVVFVVGKLAGEFFV